MTQQHESRNGASIAVPQTAIVDAMVLLRTAASYAPDVHHADQNKATGEWLRVRGLATVLRSMADELESHLSAPSESADTVAIPRKLAEHLYGTSIEAGGKCHMCKEYRAIVDAKWPQNHPAVMNNGVPASEDPPSLR
jgi:hypothetical protein